MKITRKEFEADKKVLEKYFPNVEVVVNSIGNYFSITNGCDDMIEQVFSKSFSVTDEGEKE